MIAARGWSVIPICKPSPLGLGCIHHGGQCPEAGKRPLCVWAKFQSRIASEEEIREWHRRWPGFNLALVTGSISGVMVLDADSSDAVSFVMDHEGMDAVPMATTGKGAHWYFKCHGDVARNGAGLWPHIDFRANGGYVILPPSLHRTGVRYAWHASPDILPPPPAPLWLVERITPGRKAGGAEQFVDNGDLITRAMAGFPEGERDILLSKLAAKLRGEDKPYIDAKAFTIMAASRCCPPLPDEYGIKKLDWAWAHYQPNPPAVADGWAVPGGNEIEDGDGPMPFPINVLPEVLARLVSTGAAATVAPPEYIAVPLLVAAGAVIGNRLELALKKSWTEGTNLFAACVGTPGSKKSPALKLAR